MPQGGSSYRWRDKRIGLDADLLGYLALEVPNVRRRIQQVLVSQPWPRDTMGGSVSGGDVSDPTGEHATQRWLEYDARLVAALAIVHSAIAELDHLVKGVPNPAVNIDQERSRQRCTGGEGRQGSADWGRPECEDNAVTRSGLCSACYQREHDWKRKQAAMVTE